MVLRLVPIAWHLDSYDGQTAAISIWAVWVFAEGGVLAPQQQWLTATFALQWAGGDRGSVLVPPAYQRLEGRWENGRDPAAGAATGAGGSR